MSESKAKKQVITEVATDKPTVVTSLDDIKAQLAPDIIEIPGFKPGTTINVRVKAVDPTPYILSTNLTNPLMAIATQRAKEGKSQADIKKELEQKVSEGKMDFEALMPALDAVAKEALVEPTYEEITRIHPLTVFQKMAILDYALGDVAGLASFRKQ